MIARPYWINGAIAIVPRPRGGDWLDDEMVALREAGVDVVASMLEAPEAAELGLTREDSAAHTAGLIFVNFAIPDRNVPQNIGLFSDFLSEIEKLLANGKRVGIHCRACIGRAAVVAASLLVRSGVPPSEVWHQIEVARGFPVPDTSEQREWVNRNIKATQ